MESCMKVMTPPITLTPFAHSLVQYAMPVLRCCIRRKSLPSHSISAGVYKLPLYSFLHTIHAIYRKGIVISIYRLGNSSSEISSDANHPITLSGRVRI